MKTKIMLLVIVITLAIISLTAESDEWGAIFKENAQRLKVANTMYGPEDYSLVIKKWKNPENLMEKYEKLIEISRESNTNQSQNSEERSSIISTYYYDKDNPRNNEIAELFIYSVNNDPSLDIKIVALDNLGILALEGNSFAKNFIESNLNNTRYQHKVVTLFHLQNLTIKDDSYSIQYLLNLINQSQNIKTTDLKFHSKDEVNIVWYVAKVLIYKRFDRGLNYDYVLPLLKQLIYSRCKSVQAVAVDAYYKLTNRSEMRRIYEECMAKVEDKNTPREEFLNALYGLQALYELRDIGKHKMEFKGILIYFETLILKSPTRDGLIYVENNDELRLSKEEKIYFQKRLRSK
jgi:hypothetical protein